MIPLESLDRYMVIFAIGCSVYLGFMLFLLACFLRKFSPIRTESLPMYAQPVEMRQIGPVNTFTLPEPQQMLTTRLHRSRASRSNRSICSSGTHAHRKRKKIVVVRRPDISQMERLATL